MAGSRQALIIATGAYEDQQLRRLRAPDQDAASLARVLSNPAIGDFHVEQVIDRPARLISRAVQRFFANRSLDDLLLVHLSCHGVKDDDGRLYFAATDTEKQWLASTAVSAGWFNDVMERCRARAIVLLLDCCYSGAFVCGSKGDEGVHLKDKFAGRGRAILTASNAIEYAWEGEELSGKAQPSLFTAAIVYGLETGQADRDRDGVVSIDDLYKHVYEHVREIKPAQTPMMWALGIEHGVYIARNPHLPRVEPVGLAPELRQAIEHPLASIRAGIVEDLTGLLSSSNPTLALAARQALEQLRDDDSRKVAQAATAALEHHYLPHRHHADSGAAEQPRPIVEIKPGTGSAPNELLANPIMLDGQSLSGQSTSSDEDNRLKSFVKTWTESYRALKPESNVGFNRSPIKGNLSRRWRWRGWKIGSPVQLIGRWEGGRDADRLVDGHVRAAKAGDG